MTPSGDSPVEVTPGGCSLQGVLDRAHEAAGVEVFAVHALEFLREAGWMGDTREWDGEGCGGGGMVRGGSGVVGVVVRLGMSWWVLVDLGEVCVGGDCHWRLMLGGLALEPELLLSSGGFGSGDTGGRWGFRWYFRGG